MTFKKITQNESQELAKLFSKFDINNNGTIELD